jgi:hypothetical protein
MEYFDSVDVEQRRGRPEAAEIDIIDEKSDGRVGCPLVLLQFADAADLKVARPRRVAGPIEVRHQGQNVLQVLPARVVQCIGVQHRDASRQFGKGQRPESGRDRDFIQLRVAAGVRSHGGGRGGQGGHRENQD